MLAVVPVIVETKVPLALWIFIDETPIWLAVFFAVTIKVTTTSPLRVPSFKETIRFVIVSLALRVVVAAADAVEKQHASIITVARNEDNTRFIVVILRSNQSL